MQTRRLDSHRAPALALNLAGPLLVIVSLVKHWNLAAFLLEAAWAAIAAWGLIRIVARRPNTRNDAAD